jgi:hypothetical protein
MTERWSWLSVRQIHVLSRRSSVKTRRASSASRATPMSIERVGSHSGDSVKHSLCFVRQVRSQYGPMLEMCRVVEDRVSSCVSYCC